MAKRWVNTELPNEMAIKFRGYLNENSIAFESSGAYDLVHFECLMSDIEVFKANNFIDSMCVSGKE